MTASPGGTSRPTSTQPVVDGGQEQATGEAAAVEGYAPAIEAARLAFGDALIETVYFRGETTLVVEKGPILDLLRLLRDDPALRFDRLVDLTAVDYLDLGREPRFAVVYHLMSRSSLERLRVRALVPEDDPVIDSCVALFPVANWPEREVYDMFGIAFAGHPDLTRIMMPDDWDGHPLRKDFPIGFEEIDFSFNRASVAASHPATLREREERYRSDRAVNN